MRVREREINRERERERQRERERETETETEPILNIIKQNMIGIHSAAVLTPRQSVTPKLPSLIVSQVKQ